MAAIHDDRLYAFIYGDFSFHILTLRRALWRRTAATTNDHQHGTRNRRLQDCGCLVWLLSQSVFLLLATTSSFSEFFARDRFERQRASQAHLRQRGKGGNGKRPHTEYDVTTPKKWNPVGLEEALFSGRLLVSCTEYVCTCVLGYLGSRNRTSSTSSSSPPVPCTPCVFPRGRPRFLQPGPWYLFLDSQVSSPGWGVKAGGGRTRARMRGAPAMERSSVRGRGGEWIRSGQIPMLLYPSLGAAYSPVSGPAGSSAPARDQPFPPRSPQLIIHTLMCSINNVVRGPASRTEARSVGACKGRGATSRPGWLGMRILPGLAQGARQGTVRLFTTRALGAGRHSPRTVQPTARLCVSLPFG